MALCLCASSDDITYLIQCRQRRPKPDQKSSGQYVSNRSFIHHFTVVQSLQLLSSLSVPLKSEFSISLFKHSYSATHSQLHSNSDK